ncbi:MAG: LacI family DNA-binding transcriptional regulator [Pseudomonadota bacterium]|nr:LacI family DNA-binding transcriptional regulator [Pseudomonadota bacterium]
MTDIARLAGVSTATVSRAMNGSPLVNAETRQRIVDLARSLNYTINVGAQSLRLGQNRTVAVLVPYEGERRQAVSDPFFLSLVGSLADALTDQGYDMLLSRIDADNIEQAGRYVDNGRAVGVILVGQWHHHEQLNSLAARRLPIVVWGAQLPRQLYCTVGGDNQTGGLLATAALLDEGRRRIAFMGERDLAEVAHRYQGYLLAHQRAGIRPDPDLCLSVSFLSDGGRTAVARLLADGPAFDGVFACSDLIAMGVIATLREHGIAVPEQVSVVGYDDVALAQNFQPALTTVHQSIEEGGRLLVATLLELIQNGRAEPRTLVPSLVTRASTRARPPASAPCAV